LVSLFSKECKQQNLGPKDASFDFISHCSRTLSRLAKKAGVLGTETSQVTKNDSDIQKKSTVQRISLETEEVPKIVPDEFPNELSGTVNLDPSLKDDYNTIFTPQGSTVLETQNVSDNVPHPKVHVGDENIEECIQCMGIGNILCCERCPRSFHAECLPGINEDELPEEWICPRCTDDLSEQDGDIKSGSTVVKKLTEVYGLHNGETGFVDNVTILGQLYEICEGLIKADFGSTFKDPVDLKLVPFYKKYVKRPMDLGTIMSNIRKGIYANYDSAHHKDIDGFETALQMDLIILHVLRDLELIWYNCFKFNRPDSSFYRMGAVMQIRCSVMKRLNINSKLSSFVTQNFQLFVQKCEADLQQSLSNVTEKNWIPPSKYEIHNTATGRGIIGHKRKKPVGIYDPDTKMVVKQYSSINIALSVYDFLVSKNHKSGLKSSNNVVLRHCINTSPNDPSIKLFGYRWMPMENIRSGSFKIDGEVATIVDEANVNNVELNSNSDMNGSGTNTKNDCNSKEKCEISVDNDAGNDENKGIASLNNDIKVSSQFAPLKTHQKEGHCENEIESSSSCLNREADNLSSGNPDSMDITTSQNREPLSSALNTTAYTQTKKRSLEEMNGTQAIICSPIKVTRTKIGSLCENVQYSPRVQMNALSAAKEIRCNEVVTAVDTGIIAIDISSVAIVKEYDNVVSAARNISQEELLKSIQKRILVDNILYIYASEKDEIINAMRKAVQPLDIYKT
jgi:hypothetical protein